VFSRRRRRHAVTDAAPFILTACGQDEQWFIQQLSKGGAETYTKLAPAVNQGARYEIIKALSQELKIPFPF